jgi:hypothetical protein
VYKRGKFLAVEKKIEDCWDSDGTENPEALYDNDLEKGILR